MTNKPKGLKRQSITLEVLLKEKTFLGLIILMFVAAAIVSPYPKIAMWLGFMFAGYSTIANDSIQTIGTFLASNFKQKWWVLWMFIGGIFLAVVSYSWFTFDGDVTFQRLTSKGFSEAPSSYSFLQIAAPIFLLILTRMRMPVSTTFLILSCFAADGKAIGSVLTKSLGGYFLAFGIAIVVWIIVSKLAKKLFSGEASKIWMPLQWIISGSLWAVWIMQDAANIAVYLPRSLNGYEFLAFAAFIFLGIGVLFYLRGDRIQQIVTEKSHTTDVRSATIIDFVYGLILAYKLTVSTIPMSTTWVFIGLLGGRELAMSFADKGGLGKPMKQTLKLLGKDILYAGIGLAVSLALAAAINPHIREEIAALFG